MGFVPDKKAVRPTLRGLAMATGAGVFIGLFIIFIAQVNPDTGLIPLLTNRATSFAIMTIAIGVMAALRWAHRRGLLGRGGPARADIVVGEPSPDVAVDDPASNHADNLRIGLLLAIACGVVDAAGNTLLLFGIHIGDLSVMSVLTAMYPIGTIILAGVILKERIAPVQVVGLALAIGAAAMLALS
ncbi:MAG: EamA family transporter [Actinomycetales bacterium]|nr:EamA family transporter [Actinomycetales bacterium]